MHQEQPQIQQLSASMVAKDMENNATATLDVAEVYTLQTGEETQLIPTNAPILGQIAAQKQL